MIDTEALRKKIIELAIQGKLTEQLTSDGDAETLYSQIQEEKAKLIKEGKIKKEKSLPSISDNEILFDIPSNWKWVHLNNIATSSLGKTLNRSTDKGDELPYLCSINVYWEGIKLDSVKKAKFDEVSKANYRLQKGDLLICEGGDSGRSAIWTYDEEMYYQNALHRVRFYGNIKPEFFCFVLEYYKKSGIINRFTTGIGIQHLVQSSLNAMWLPLPPLAEQKRIVEKLDTVLVQINNINDLQQQYESDLSVLKSKIIDAGIRGKLTEQLPEDGDAETLYSQIQEEKSKLIKEGKIKKEKLLPEIDADEIPFDIPQNWKWVRLADISNIINGDRGKNYPAKSTLSIEGIPFISALNLNGKSVDDDDRLLCLSDEQYNKLGSGKLQKDDVVICIRGSLGKHGRYPFEKGAIASSLVICRPHSFSDEIGEYIMKWLDSSMFPREIDKYDGGSAQPNLAAENLKKFLVPLPPIPEQKRIADTINAMLSLID